MGGELVEPYPALSTVRERTLRAISELPAEVRKLSPASPRHVAISERLLKLAESTRRSLRMMNS
jgi:hypothetical protein